MNEITAAKRELRSRLKTALATVHASQRPALSAGACARAIDAGLFPSGSTVLLYAPSPAHGEVDLTPLADALLARGCRICVPHVDWKTSKITPAQVSNLTTDLVPDPHLPARGIRVPRPGAPEVPAGQLDVVVLPGLGFDPSGGRIGRGAGFYDRFLATLPADRPLRVALAFDEQVVDRVPRDDHDQPIHVIVTPTRVLRAG